MPRLRLRQTPVQSDVARGAAYCHTQPKARPLLSWCAHSVGLSDITEPQCPALGLGKADSTSSAGTQYCVTRQERRICVLFLADRFAQVRVVRTLWVDPNGVGAVVEVPDHAALVERQIQFISSSSSGCLAQDRSRRRQAGPRYGRDGSRWSCRTCRIPHRPDADSSSPERSTRTGWFS